MDDWEVKQQFLQSCGSKIHNKIIDIELTNYCNLKCKYCTIQNSIIKKMKTKTLLYSGKKKIIKKWLNWNLIYSFLKNMSRKNIIWFSGIGEPTRHPEFCSIIYEVNKLGFPIYLNTNLSFSNIVSRFQEIDFINISCNGITKEEFFKKTGKDYFDDFKWNLDFMKERSIPFRLSYVRTDRRQNKEALKQKIKDNFNVNHIRIIDIHHRILDLKQKNLKKTCGLYNNYIHMDVDGNILACINDLKKVSLKEKTFPFSFCKTCDDPLRIGALQENYYDRVLRLKEVKPIMYG